ncbi:hypothetical protein ACEUZ9_004124 [Paracoccus litorisediminis]|uniref:hypothetical protein n=1 Tax=Paracoccus litorisediminis TaxID=2006130 RepID=UPI0037319F0C
METVATWWHGALRQIEDLVPIISGPGMHLGTRVQASMRNSAFLHEIEVVAGRLGRARDRQDWSSVARRARSDGKTGVLYLNRHEGMEITRIEELISSDRIGRIDDVGDAQFRKWVPEARDSLLLVDPDAARLIRVFDRSGGIVWEREVHDEYRIR